MAKKAPRPKPMALPDDLRQRAAARTTQVLYAPAPVASELRAQGAGAVLTARGRVLFVLGDLVREEQLFHVTRMLHFVEGAHTTITTGRAVPLASPQRGRDQGPWAAFDAGSA